MWLTRQLREIANASGIVLFNASDRWGISHIISALDSQEQPLVWVRLDEEDAGDPIVQGNKLSDAVKRALGSPLFGYGLHFSYGIAALGKHLDLLGPFSFALTGADNGADLAWEIAGLHNGSNRVFLAFEDIPKGAKLLLPYPYVLIGKEVLGLTPEESYDLTEGLVSRADASSLWEESGGAIEDFKVLLNKKLALPPTYRPTPLGLEPQSSGTARIQLDQLLDALINREKWIEAFELAVNNFPDRVEQLIEEAGEAYFAKGLFDRFWKLISRLPDHVVSTDKVMRWKFAGATAVNMHRDISLEIESYLEEHEAPELRALYAVALPTDESLEEVERAFRADKTPTTLRMYGFALAFNRGSKDALQYFHKALKLSEVLGKDHYVVASAVDICNHLIFQGKYPDALNWAQWALDQYYERGINEELRRLAAISCWAFSKILCGTLIGLESVLEEIVISPRLFGIPTIEGIVSTMGDFALISGDPQKALNLYRINLINLPRNHIAYATVDMVRALIALGRSSEAIELAGRAVSLTKDSSHLERLFALLAKGMALSTLEPDQAIIALQESLTGFRQILHAPRLAEAGLRLASLYLNKDFKEEARATLEVCRPGIQELGEAGWLLLGGPGDDIREMFGVWRTEIMPLRLTYLNGRSIIIDGLRTALSLRWCELLCVLAAHPNGLNSEPLALLIYGDHVKPSTLKAHLSKLRKLVPISSRPYRIEVPFSADFLEVESLLREGRVREALELYGGPLLPESQAPGVIELREQLEEAVRQAVLVSGDPSVLLQLARKAGDDLELWEAAEKVVSPNDPQFPLVRARVRRIRRSWSL